MRAETRRDGIMGYLMENGTVSVDDLAALFHVSRMTIHRDLDELEGEGFLRKVRGGATIKSNLQFESDFRYRKRLAVAEKRAIARAALNLIEPGQAVILDDGTTVEELASHISEKRPLTVITNSVPCISILAGIHGIDLIAVGGQYIPKYNGFFGLMAENTLAALKVDAAFISTSAVDGQNTYHQLQEVVKTKRAMIAAAENSYLLADSTKFGKTALNYLTGVKAFRAIITGQPLSEALAREFAQAGVALQVANDPS